MRVCLVSKYPPQQGGVATQAMWMAAGLASRGHAVAVVTDSDGFAHIGSRTSVPRVPYRSTEPIGVLTAEPQIFRTNGSANNRGHMPDASRLAALTVEVVRQVGAEVIVGYYLEPYCLAASLAASSTGVPLVVRHAGSDLFRLAKSAELRSIYSGVLTSAHSVLSTYSSTQELSELGVQQSRIFPWRGVGIPTHIFSPNAAPLDDLVCLLPDEDSGPLIVGVYGKLGIEKGSFALVEAIHQLHLSGIPIHLLAMTHGECEDEFSRFISDREMELSVTRLPYVTNDAVPRFIRSCHVVACLEHNFPITAHSPLCPREVVACGTPLLISEELAQKQIFRSRIRNRHNVHVLENPADIRSLAATLKFIADDRRRAAALGRTGKRELSVGVDFATSLKELEEILDSACADPYDLNGRVRHYQQLRNRFPLTFAALTSQQRSLVANMLCEHSSSSGISLDDINAVERCVAHIVLDSSEIRELCRFEALAYRWLMRRTPRNHSRRVVAMLDRMTSNSVPRMLGIWSLEVFRTPMENISAKWQRTSDERSSTVLFSTVTNPILVTRDTAELIRKIGLGQLSLGQLAQEMKAEPPIHTSALLPVIERLCWSGVVDVDEPKP